MIVRNFGLEYVLAEAGDIGYDLIISCLGYEQRAIAVPNKLSNFEISQRIAIGFEETRKLNYIHNRAWYLENNTSVRICAVEEISSLVVDALMDCDGDSDGCIRTIVDISCFSSDRLAAIIEGIQLYQYKDKRKVQVDFQYSLAQYDAAHDKFIPNRKIGPISPFFAGWKTSFNTDHIAIIGLGFEKDKALGVHEYLEPKKTWLYIPHSPEEKYLGEVLKINKTLLGANPTENKINYDVTNPSETFSTLSALTRSIARLSSPIVVPFGPKIFVLASLLVGIEQFDVPIWRVSGKDPENPNDRVASEHFVGLRVLFNKSILTEDEKQ